MAQLQADDGSTGAAVTDQDATQTGQVAHWPKGFMQEHPELQNAMMLAVLAALVLFVMFYGRKKK